MEAAAETQSQAEGPERPAGPGRARPHSVETEEVSPGPPGSTRWYVWGFVRDVSSVSPPETGVESRRGGQGWCLGLTWVG